MKKSVYGFTGIVMCTILSSLIFSQACKQRSAISSVAFASSPDIASALAKLAQAENLIAEARALLGRGVSTTKIWCTDRNGEWAETEASGNGDCDVEKPFCYEGPLAAAMEKLADLDFYDEYSVSRIENRGNEIRFFLSGAQGEVAAKATPCTD